MIKRIEHGKVVKLIEDWAHNILDENHKREAETHRWLLCWDGESADSSFDCGCCLSKYPYEYGCGCICHERIESLARHMIENLIEEQ